MKSSKAERDTAPFPGDSFPFLPVPKHALPQLRNRSGGFLQGFVKCQPPESHSSPQCLEFEETLFSGLLGGLLDLRHPGCLVLALVASLATSLRPVLPRPCGWELGALLWICTDSSGTSPTWLTFTFPPCSLTRFLSSLSLLCFPHPSLGCLLFPSERKKNTPDACFFPLQAVRCLVTPTILFFPNQASGGVLRTTVLRAMHSGEGPTGGPR